MYFGALLAKIGVILTGILAGINSSSAMK